MKKALLGLCISTLLISCGTTSDEINVTEMTDACECSDALITIANDILFEFGNTTEAELNENPTLKAAMKSKFEKLDSLEQKCRKELGVTMDEMITCNPQLSELMQEFDAKF